MEKKYYVSPEFEVIEFEEEDIIVSSGEITGEKTIDLPIHPVVPN